MDWLKIRNDPWRHVIRCSVGEIRDNHQVARVNQWKQSALLSAHLTNERTHRAKTWRNNCECTTSSSSSQRSTSGQWSSGRGRCGWWMSDKWQSTGITWIFLLHLLMALDIPWPADVLKTTQSRQRQLYMDKDSTVVSVMPCAKWSFVTWRSLGLWLWMNWDCRRNVIFVMVWTISPILKILSEQKSPIVTKWRNVRNACVTFQLQLNRQYVSLKMYPATNMYHNWIYLYPRIYMGGSGGGGCDVNHDVRFVSTRFSENQAQISSGASTQCSTLSIVYVLNSILISFATLHQFL